MSEGRPPGRGARAARGHGRWPARVLRGLRSDRNPLRRTCDRVEICLLAGLFLASAATTPLRRRPGHRSPGCGTPVW